MRLLKIHQESIHPGKLAHRKPKMKRNCNKDKTWIPPEESKDHAKDLRLYLCGDHKREELHYMVSRWPETSKMRDRVQHSDSTNTTHA